ncbi:MAG: LysR family transcriptional regulator [Paracoccaceae bacterium]|nr:MAG: LysR family transcriptional regulator [Paracoccaceae bacterium]
MHNHLGMHPGIKLRHVRVFLDIAASGNLSAVARQQGITQPAVSRSLAELEVLLGQSLFLRTGRRLVLTEAGQVFRRHAAQALAALDQGAAAMRPGGPGGRLSVGVLPTAATRLFPQAALRFHALRPGTVLTVTTGPHAFLMELLRRGRIDLMLGRMPAPDEMAGLSFAHLYEEDIVLCARAGHPMAVAPLAEMLARVPVILPPAGAIIRRAVDDFLASQGLAGIRPAVETVALALGRGIVRGSDAVWFISRGVILEELERGELILMPAAARFLSGAVGITGRQGATSEDAEILSAILRDAAGRTD